VLHASGVVLRGSAALFAGPQGAGKSSLAAALLRRGAALLSDDTVALQPRGGALIAHPGAALLHLRADEHERLSTRERAVLGSPTAVLGKQRYSPSVTASPAPLRELFLLERSTHGPPSSASRRSTPSRCWRAPSTCRCGRQSAWSATRPGGRPGRHGRIYRLRVQPGIDATQLAEIVHEYLLEL